MNNLQGTEQQGDTAQQLSDSPKNALRSSRSPSTRSSSPNPLEAGETHDVNAAPAFVSSVNYLCTSALALPFGCCGCIYTVMLMRER